MTSNLHKPPNAKKGNWRSAFPDTPNTLESHVNTSAELRKETRIEPGATENPEHTTTKWGSSQEHRRGPASPHVSKIKAKIHKIIRDKEQFSEDQRTVWPWGVTAPHGTQRSYGDAIFTAAR